MDILPRALSGVHIAPECTKTIQSGISPEGFSQPQDDLREPNAKYVESSSRFVKASNGETYFECLSVTVAQVTEPPDRGRKVPHRKTPSGDREDVGSAFPSEWLFSVVVLQ